MEINIPSRTDEPVFTANEWICECNVAVAQTAVISWSVV